MIFCLFQCKLKLTFFDHIKEGLSVRVFISWSGQRSKAIAEIFSDWMKCVIQASQPWISTRDIDRGAIWFSEINDKLKDVSVGVVCLTQENKNRPWILFETGALAKGLSTNRVCTFLIDLKPQDLQDPLAQFNHTTPDKFSVWELIKTINACLAEKALDERILKQVFDTYWPQFEESFGKALIEHPQNEVIPSRSEEDILSEILHNTRALTQRVRTLENHSRDSFDMVLDVHNTSKKSPAWVVQNKITSMLKTGLFSEDDIVASVDLHGYTEEEIRNMIHALVAVLGVKINKS